MPTIQCPECSTQVSSRAAACPKCAHPFHNQSSSIFTKSILVFIAFLLFVGISIYGFNTLRSIISKDTNKTPKILEVVNEPKPNSMESEKTEPSGVTLRRIEELRIGKIVGKYRQSISGSTKNSMLYYQFNSDKTGAMYFMGSPQISFTWTSSASRIVCTAPDETLEFIKNGDLEIELVGGLPGTVKFVKASD